jgi:hypothetical protein
MAVLSHRPSDAQRGEHAAEVVIGEPDLAVVEIDGALPNWGPRVSRS